MEAGNQGSVARSAWSTLPLSTSTTSAGAAAETAPAQRALKAKAAKRTARRASMRGQLRAGAAGAHAEGSAPRSRDTCGPLGLMRLCASAPARHPERWADREPARDVRERSTGTAETDKTRPEEVLS